MNFDEMQVGFYKARGVEGSEQFGHSNEGGEQISVELDVQVSDQEVVRCTTILAFSGKAAPISIERLKALGWDGSNELRGIGRNEVDVEVKLDTYNGKTSKKVEIKTNGGGRFSFKKPMADQEKRGFMASLSKQASQLGAAPQGAPTQAGPNGYPKTWDTSGPPPQGQGKPVL
jgi:hypothetical protein